jgi:hypothetical protein
MREKQRKTERKRQRESERVRGRAGGRPQSAVFTVNKDICLWAGQNRAKKTLTLKCCNISRIWNGKKVMGG